MRPQIVPFFVHTCSHKDSALQKEDLMRYGAYGLSARVVDRIWDLRRDTKKPGMGYPDFVYFILGEEDKQSPASLQVE